MNRTLKAVFVAIALIVVGSVLAGCGFLGMDGVWDGLTGSGKLVTTQEIITDDFTNIDIDILSADLEFCPSPDGTCYYKAETYDNMFCTAEVENGTLKLGQDDNRLWYQHIGIYWEKTSLALYLPKDAYDQLTISGDTSDVTIPNLFTFENAQITTDTGDMILNCHVTKQMNLACATGNITARDVAPETINAATSTGNVKMERITCSTLSVSTDTGNCHLENTQVTQTLSLASATGSKYLTGVSCGSLEMKATTGDNNLTNVTISGNIQLESNTGDWELKNVIASGDAKLESDTGDWELRGFDAANITIDTDTGDVEGTLLTDKIFFVDSDTGRIDVPRTATGGTCEITTDTGDIEIEIVS